MKKFLNLDGIEFMLAFFVIAIAIALALCFIALVVGGIILIADNFFALPEWLSAIGNFLI